MTWSALPLRRERTRHWAALPAWRGGRDTARAMSQENVELVRRAFGASSRGDAETLVALCGPGFKMHLVGVAGEPVYYAGASGIREFFRDLAESWDAFGYEALDIRDLGDRVVVLGTVRARGRTSGIDVEAQRGWIVELRDGRITSIRSFRDPQKALEVAGLL